MDWILVAIFALAAIVYIFFERSGQISPQDAQAHLKSGALVIDVRTPAEFIARHLPGAINYPVDQIQTTFPPRVRDKSQPILLHCQSGMRSGVAKRKLRAIGYINAYNLGSYSRAERIVKSA